MTEKNSKALGFTLVEISLTVVSVFVLAGIGFAVYQHNKTQAINTAPSTSQANNQKAVTTPSSQTGTYLTVKEWGVKLPLDNTVKDAYYLVSTVSSKDADGKPGTIWLGLSSITDPNCNPTNNNSGKSGAIGAILRIPLGENDAVTGQPLTQEYPNGVTIGSYYYAYSSETSDKTCVPRSTLDSIDTSFAHTAKNTATTTN
jgi:Tfp pilus assembly protein PilE